MSPSAYYLPLDALPEDVRGIYEEVERSVNGWITAMSTEQEQNIFEYYETQLVSLTPKQGIRFLCNLVKRWPNTEYPWAASLLDERDSQGRYISWLALRLMQAVCLYIGASRLRTARNAMSEEWAALPVQRRPALYFTCDVAGVGELLQFCFAVLIPTARANVPRRESRPTREASTVVEESLRNLRPERPAKTSPPTRTASPKKLDSLCAPGFTVAELRELLTSLDVLDPVTGKWHLGDRTGKGASQKSAFPAAYRALVKAGLMLPVASPIYRKLFEEAFGFKLSDRTANYKEGHGSTAFDDYLAESRRWIHNMRIRRESTT